jgi:hypothetical protein
LLSANHMTSHLGRNAAGSGAGWRRRFFQPVERYRSIDWYLRLLVISTLAPALAFSAYLLWNFISFERRSYEQQLQQSAIDLAHDIDRDIEGLIVKLSTLATSPSLHRGDLAEFHAQATEAAVRDSNIVVLDLSLHNRLPIRSFPMALRCRRPMIRRPRCERSRASRRRCQTCSLALWPATFG